MPAGLGRRRKWTMGRPREVPEIGLCRGSRKRVGLSKARGRAATAAAAAGGDASARPRGSRSGAAPRGSRTPRTGAARAPRARRGWRRRRSAPLGARRRRAARAAPRLHVGGALRPVSPGPPAATARIWLSRCSGAERRPCLPRVALGAQIVSYGPRGVRQVPPAAPSVADALANRRDLPDYTRCGARSPEAAPRARPPSCAAIRRVVPPRGLVAGRRARSQTSTGGRSTSCRTRGNGLVRRFGRFRATIDT